MTTLTDESAEELITLEGGRGTIRTQKGDALPIYEDRRLRDVLL